MNETRGAEGQSGNPAPRAWSCFVGQPEHGHERYSTQREVRGAAHAWQGEPTPRVATPGATQGAAAESI